MLNSEHAKVEMKRHRRILICLLLWSLSTLSVGKTINEGVSEDRLNFLLNSKHFFILEPPILAMLKIEDMTRNPHYVQIFLALRHEDKAGDIGYYKMKLRDRAVHLLGTKTFAYISSLRGRRLVIFELLKEFQKVMYDETGDPAIDEIEIIELIVE